MSEILESMIKDFESLLGGKRAADREQYENAKNLVREKYSIDQGAGASETGIFGLACRRFVPVEMQVKKVETQKKHAQLPPPPTLPSFVIAPPPSNGNGKTVGINLTGLLRKIAKDTGELPSLRIIAVMAEYSGKSPTAGNASISLLRDEFDIQAGKIDGFIVTAKKDPRVTELEDFIAKAMEQLERIKNSK